MLNAIVPSFVEIASWQVALLLGFSFLGSALTAALSIGGGTLMIAVLSLVLPAPIIVPLHGMIQLGSNGGRVVLLRRNVSWPVFVPISIGIIIGAVFASFLVMDVPANLLRIAIALFIIYSAWGPKFKNPGTSKVSYVIGGAITSFLSMFIGASGPFLVAILASAQLDRIGLTATAAACMALKHGIKIVLFAWLGFAFIDLLPLGLALIAAGFAGTFLGTKLLYRLPEQVFRRGLKIILTGMALYLIGMSLRGQ